MKRSSDAVIYLSLLSDTFKKDTNNNSFNQAIEPVRLHIQNKTDLHTFSLVKFLTDYNELAFFFQWFMETNLLIYNNDLITKINQEYFSKKVDKNLRGLTNLKTLLSRDLNSTIIPTQISFFSFISRENIDFFTRKYPATNRFLNSQYLTKIQDALSFNDTLLYQNTPNLTQKLHSLGYGGGFLQIGFPLLVSLSYKYSLPEVPFSANDVKWLVLEEVVKNISILQALKDNKKIAPFLYQSLLNETELYKFYQMNLTDQMAESLTCQAVQDQILEIKEKLYQNTTQKIGKTCLPEEDVQILSSMLEWAKSEDDL